MTTANRLLRKVYANLIDFGVELDIMQELEDYLKSSVTTDRLAAQVDARFKAIVREAAIRECAELVSDWQSEEINFTAGEYILHKLLD